MRVQSFYEWLVLVLLCLLFVLADQMKRAVIYFLIFVVLFVFDHVVMDLVEGRTLSFLSMLSIGGRLMLPCSMVAAYLLHTTSVHAFVHGLRKWHVPEKFLLTLAVMMRFLPTIPQDYRTIRQSLTTRGIFVSGWSILLKPHLYFEQVMVPLLMSASRTAQDLTIATLTKSVGSTGTKTSYIDYRMGRWDALVLTFVAVLVILIQMGVGA